MVVKHIGILVLIPLFAGDRNSEYVKHHLNQGFILFIAQTVVNVLNGNWIYKISGFLNFASLFSTIFDVIELGLFIVAIIGIVSACKGDKREIPIISQFEIWK